MAVARKALFNTRRHRVLRKHVPVGENITSLLVAGALALLVLWVVSQREHFDPATRELPPELLQGSRPEIAIYTPPLKIWAAPGLASAATPDLGLFPPAMLDGEWTLAGRVRRFDAGNLYEKINGEAEKFFKHGFRALHYALIRAQGDGAEIGIELYDQGDVGGSSGIFAAHGAADREVRERGGVAFYETGVGVIGRKGRFFFRAAGDRSSDSVTAKAAQLVDAFAGLEDATQTAPEGLRLLTRVMGVAEADVALLQENAFQLDFAKDFWFGRLPDTDDGELFVHVAASEQAATKLLDALLEEQRHEYREIASDTPWTTMRHGVLGTYFAIGLRGRVLFGLHRLADPDRIAALMARFAGELRDD
jgi:hypothetical protein